MNVVIFAPFAVTEYHFATDLEIAQTHLEKGDHVTMVVCNADLLTCESNPDHDLGRCVRCVGHRFDGISRLTPRPEVISFPRLTAQDREELRGISVDGMTLDDLRDIRFENFDAGWAVRSSIISAVGTSAFPFESKKDRIRDSLRSSLAVYRSMQRLLTERKVDRVYAFNGRYATMRAVLRAAQSKGVDCYIHERGCNFERYALWENHLPHEIDYYQERIRDAWEHADPELRDAIGASFFADRITGSLVGWVSFSVNQESGLMPEGWRDDANNVAVFTSSTDDLDALDDAMKGGAYPDQYLGLNRVVAATPPDSGTHFYVRVHPRTQALPEPQAKELMNLKLPHLTVIPAGSPVSTYALMRRATRVLSFGSTTGIEAVHWRKPSIIGMRAYYDRLGSTYNPRNHDEMLDLILKPGLPPKDPLGATMFGYYNKTFGTPFRFFRPLGLFSGAFKGTPVRPHAAVRTAGWLLDHAPGREPRSHLHLKLVERRMLAP
jgi:hypothetical protein